MNSNVVLVLANAEDEADEVVAIVPVASGDHFRSSILLAAEVADADAVAAGRPTVMIIQCLERCNYCANGAEHVGIWCGIGILMWRGSLHSISFSSSEKYKHQSFRA